MGQRGRGAVGTELQLLGRKSSGDLFSRICTLNNGYDAEFYILLQWRNFKNKLRGTGQAQRAGRVW